MNLLKKYSFLAVLLGISLLASAALKKGDLAPDFKLKDETGTLRSLQEFKNKKVVLYFYPMDNTPHCTAQACQLRNAYAIYKEHDIVILGISFDSVKSHAQFKKDHNLPFTLLSDNNKKVAHLYGADKGFTGYLVANRITVLIDEHGKIVQTIKDVTINTHSDEILKAYGIK